MSKLSTFARGYRVAIVTAGIVVIGLYIVRNRASGSVGGYGGNGASGSW